MTIEAKLIPREKLSELAKTLKAQGKKIVTSNGCFDLLHWGHIKYLQGAKALGDVLIVGINSDHSVKKLEKGSERPLFPAQIRAFQVAGLASVDYVCIFEEDTPIEFIKLVHPQIHVKGADYEGKELPERATVESAQGKIAFIPLVPGFSTTSLVNKLKS